MKTTKEHLGTRIKTVTELIKCANEKKWIVTTSYSNYTTLVASCAINYQLSSIIKLIENKHLYRYKK